MVPNPGFERYYDTFLQNSMAGKRFQITLKDGNTYEGVPTAGSIANPADADVSFRFRDAGNAVRSVRFIELHNATPL